MNFGDPVVRRPGLAPRITALRRELGISQRVAAMRAGVSDSVWRSLECYERASTRTIEGAAKAFGLTVEQLTDPTKLSFPAEDPAFKVRR